MTVIADLILSTHRSSAAVYRNRLAGRAFSGQSQLSAPSRYPRSEGDLARVTLCHFCVEGHPASYRRRLLATSGLTQQRSGSSVSPAMRLSAAMSAIPLRLFTDALAMWGTITAF